MVDQKKWSFLILKLIKPQQPFRYKNRWWEITGNKNMIYTIEPDQLTRIQPLSPTDFKSRVAIFKQ